MKPESLEQARKRAPNFTRHETKVLVEVVQLYASIIDCKKTNHSSNAEKNRAWVQLARDFNAKLGGDPYRSATVLKHRYGNMRKEASRRLRTKQTDSNVLQTSSNPPLDDADIMENIVQSIQDDTEDYMEDESISTINDRDMRELIHVEVLKDEVDSDVECVSDDDPLIMERTDNSAQTDVVEAEKVDVETPVNSKISDTLEDIQKKCYLEKHHLEVQQMKEKHQIQLDMMRQEHRERTRMMKEEHDTKMKLLELEKTVGILNQI